MRQRCVEAVRRWAVPGIALGAVLVRLPYLGAAHGSDEAGYLTVARQWHGAGPSLYGHYWVDRPPLLIAIFQLAGVLGGLTALRVIAAIGVGVAVLGIAAVARRVAGPRAAVWSALVATALFASPLMGVIQINGELLAAPFVAWSLAFGLRALEKDQHGGRAAFAAGALAVAALLVKQNMAEPIVFCTVAAFVAMRSGRVSGRAVVPLVAGAAAGGAATLIAVGAWTLGHGTSLAAVFQATYPFRIRAAHVLASFPDNGQVQRSHHFLYLAVTSGVLLLLVLFASAVLRRRLAGPVAWGLLATLTWSTLSIVAGGGFWDHYLVELVVPISIAAGLCVAPPQQEPGRRPVPAPPRPAVRLLPLALAVAVLGVAAVHWVTGLEARQGAAGTSVGIAIASAARPGDTVVSAFGDAQTVESAGLLSPYPYLWTLPAQVQDPELHDLTALLTGPSGPTWFVPWERPSFPVPVLQQLRAVVAARYHPVAVVCGHTIYVRNGLVRPAPSLQPACSGENSVALAPGTEAGAIR